MNKITSEDSFVFNGILMQTGDIISFSSNLLPLPGNTEVQACFVQVDSDGNLHGFSTLLAPFNFKRPGIFSPDQVQNLRIVKKGEEAIQEQSRNPILKHGQRCTTSVEGTTFEGELLGAFDGVVTMWCDTISNFVSGGSSHFSPVKG